MRAGREIAAGLMALALGGCSLGFNDTRGFVPDEEQLAQLEPGRQTRDDVQQILGSPASQGVFDSEQSWYYIMRKTYQFAFLEPEVLDQKVVVVYFDSEGTLRDIRRYSLEDGMIVDPVKRETPSPGKELGFLEQLIGNLGKFNKSSSPSGR